MTVRMYCQYSNFILTTSQHGQNVSLSQKGQELGNLVQLDSLLFNWISRWQCNLGIMDWFVKRIKC